MSYDNNFMTYMWRRLHCMNRFRLKVFERTESDLIDAGYCLDRYSIEDEGGNVFRSLP